MPNVIVAAVQMSCVQDPAENLAHAEMLYGRLPGRGRRLCFCRNCLNGRIFARNAGMSTILLLCRCSRTPLCDAFRKFAPNWNL